MAKTGWPRAIDVAGHKVKLAFVPLNELFGQYHHDRKLIEVNAGISEREKLLTIRHELMEASLLISGVGFGEAYQQEQIVRCMEEVFFPAWDTLLKRLAKQSSKAGNPTK